MPADSDSAYEAPCARDDVIDNWTGEPAGPPICAPCSELAYDYVEWDGHTERERRLIRTVRSHAWAQATDAIPDEVTAALSRILDPSAHQRWWRTPVPAWGGFTPEEMWEADPPTVRQRLADYVNPSYG